MAGGALIITGCAGFIGLNVLKHISNNANFDFIISIDKLGYATQYNLSQYTTICEDVKRRICRFDCDINNVDVLKKFLHENWAVQDYWILDFASNSHVDKSIENPSVLYNENCTIPSNLLAALGKDNFNNIRHYFHISTDEVYGDIPLTEKDDRFRHFTPMSSLRPSNPYSASKVAQDMYLTSIYRTFGTPVTIIRMANQFGPWQHPEKMLPASILRALRSQTIKIYGEGRNCRQWTFVEDTVAAIDDIITTGDLRKSFYNPPIIHLADKKNLMDNNELIRRLVLSLKRYNIEPQIEYITDRLGHDEMYALRVLEDDEKFFKTPFDVALDKTVDFYVERFKNGDFT